MNNYDWTASLSTIDFLRDIGKHFPVNKMLAREVVRSRLEAGISYTEFSYVLLQSMDYLNLFRDHGVHLQTGGSDQWGNITAGVDLVRRVEGGKVHALATPLVTKADGTKFGKTEGGSIWLDAEMTSPYAFYQFWFNTDDRDVVSMLKYYTFRSRDEIEELAKAGGGEAVPAGRPACPRRRRDHADARRRPRPSGSRPLLRRCSAAASCATLDAPTLDAALQRGAARRDPDAGELPLATSTCSPRPDSSRARARPAGRSPRAARTSTTSGSPTGDASADADDLLPGGWLLLRRGKRNLAGVKVG